MPNKLKKADLIASAFHSFVFLSNTSSIFINSYSLNPHLKARNDDILQSFP